MTAANIAEFISLQASIERVTGLLDEKPQIADTPEVIARYGDAFHPKRENWEPIKGDVDFEHVSFAYKEGEKVLKGQVIADGPATKNGEISLGKNALIGWEAARREQNGRR